MSFFRFNDGKASSYKVTSFWYEFDDQRFSQFKRLKKLIKILKILLTLYSFFNKKEKFFSVKIQTIGAKIKLFIISYVN